MPCLCLLNSSCLCSFDKVKNYLQQHLSSVEQSNILEKTDKNELYLLYVNCLEVHMNFVFNGSLTFVQQPFLSFNVIHFFFFL